MKKRYKVLRIFHKIKNPLLSSPSPESDERLRIAYVFNNMLIALSIMIFLAMPIALFVSNQKLIATVILSALLLVNYIALQFSRHGKINLAVIGYISYAWINSAIVVYLTAGMMDTACGLFIPIIAIATLLLGFRAGALITSLSLIYLLALLATVQVGFTIPQVFVFSEFTSWVLFLFSSILVLVPLTLMHQELLKAIRRVNEQLVQRQQAETALRESEERFRIISSVTSDYTFSSKLDVEGNLEHVLLTGAFEAISGYTPEEFLALGGWQRTIHPDDIEQDKRDMEVLRRNEKVVSELRIIRKNGEVRWVRVYAHPIWDDEQKRLAYVNGGVQDITERKEAEEAILKLNTELEYKAAQLSSLNDIARDISVVTDLSSTLQRIQVKLNAILPLDVFFVALYEDDSNAITFPIMYDSGKYWNEEQGNLSPSGWVWQVLSTGQALLLNRTEEEIESDEAKHPRLGDINKPSASILMSPLPIGNKLIGVISVQSYSFNVYKEEHIDLLQSAAYQIAIAVENARLYDSLRNELSERKRLENELQDYTSKLEIIVDERTNALRDAKEQLELILDNTSDALLFANPNGDILVTNPAFKIGFGQEELKSIEHIFSFLIDEEQIEAVSHALMSVRYNGESHRMTIQVSPNRGDKIKDIDLALIPISTPDDNSLNGILLSGRDITQQKEIERFKAHFVADALHDLATPISGLSTRIYLLERTPEKLREHVQALQNQVQHLKNLLEDLRTLSKIDRAQMDLDLKPCNINDLVKRVFDTYEPVALGKKQTLTLKLVQTLPEIPLDELQIERVFVNLVSNAINYTSGNKEIIIQTSQDEQAIIFEVIDQGIGIKEEAFSQVFERFYRSDEARGFHETGTGLGLAITKEIVELHGGSVAVRSEAGIGSTFTIRLPLSRAE